MRISDHLAPTEDRLLVTRIVENTTPGGIAIPQSAKAKQFTATVEAVGPDAKDFSEGDKILISRSGVKIEYNGTELMCVRSGEVVAKVKQ